MGLAGCGPAKHLRLGTRHQYRHPVGEACCRRGGVAGAEPPHKGGPNRPDRPEKQFLVLSFQFLVNCFVPGGQMEGWGQWSVVRGGAFSASELDAEWLWFRCCQRYARARPYFGMHPQNQPVCRRGEKLLECVQRYISFAAPKGRPRTGESYAEVQGEYRILRTVKLHTPSRPCGGRPTGEFHAGD